VISVIQSTASEPITVSVSSITNKTWPTSDTNSCKKPADTPRIFKIVISFHGHTRSWHLWPGRELFLCTAVYCNYELVQVQNPASPSVQLISMPARSGCYNERVLRDSTPAGMAVHERSCWTTMAAAAYPIYTVPRRSVSVGYRNELCTTNRAPHNDLFIADNSYSSLDNTISSKAFTSLRDATSWLLWRNTIQYNQ